MLELCRVTKVYQTSKQPVYALQQIDLKIEKGSFAALVGESGSGKSTLMNIAGCLDTATSGDVFIQGREVSGMGERERAALRCHEIGFVFQTFHLLPYLTALENVMLPMMFAGIERENQRAIARDLLERVGLRSWQHHRPGELSGGQCQRVCLARALANRPSIVLADEPTSNLDLASGQAVIQLLRSCSDSGITVLMVTHNPANARQCDICYSMQGGRLQKG